LKIIGLNSLPVLLPSGFKSPTLLYMHSVFAKFKQ